MSFVKQSYLHVLFGLIFSFIVSSSYAEETVIGGSKIDISMRPYTALVVQADDPDFAKCTAVILDSNWILTAGHCVDQGIVENDILVKADVSLTFGNVQVSEVAEIIRHPGFSTFAFTTQGNDIALLRLKTPLTFNNRVQKIRPATPQDTDIIRPGVVGTLSGFGDTSEDPDGPANFDLNTVDLPIVSLMQANIPSIFNGRITTNMLPAGSTSDNKSSCSGDSGGPFVVTSNDGSTKVLAGISSFGSCDEDINSPYSVFTRISAFSTWINNVMEGKLTAWFVPSLNVVFQFDELYVRNITTLNNTELSATTYFWEMKNPENEVIFTSTLIEPKFVFPDKGIYTITLTASNATGESKASRRINVLGRCASIDPLNEANLSVLRSGGNNITSFKRSRILTSIIPISEEFVEVVSSVTVYFDTPLQLDANSDMTIALNVNNGEGGEGFAEIVVDEVKNQINRDGKFTFDLDRRVRINDGSDLFEVSLEASSMKRGDDVIVLALRDENTEYLTVVSNNPNEDGDELPNVQLGIEGNTCKSISPDFNLNPWVSMSSPNAYATFETGAAILFKAEAEDADGTIERVNFRVDGELLRSDNSAPYEQVFTPEEPGVYILQVVAVDNDNGRRSSVDLTILVEDSSNEEPTVEITSPVDGAVFELGEEITLKANASDPDGNLDKVNFKINDRFFKTVTTRPFESLFIPEEPGTYKIGARAFDLENAQKEVFITITVVEQNQAPTASFTTPVNDSIEEGYTELVITVDATDPEEDRLTVVLKINGTEIRSESVAPYEWGHAGSPNPSETLGLEVGDNLLEALITDEKGASVMISKTITVTERIVTSLNTLVDEGQFTVYPNPSLNGKFNLSHDAPWQVITLQGELVKSGVGNEINLTGNAHGTYFVKVGNEVKKVVLSE